MTQQASYHTSTWPNVRRPAPTALPIEYDIERVPSTALFELRWNGLALDRLPSIGDAIEAGLAHAALVEAETGDTGMGDIHTPEAQWAVEAQPIAALELAMLDSCLGAPRSDGEAGCVLVELESRGIYVEPVDCAWCGRTHLVKAGR